MFWFFISIQILKMSEKAPKTIVVQNILRKLAYPSKVSFMYLEELNKAETVEFLGLPMWRKPINILTWSKL